MIHGRENSMGDEPMKKRAAEAAVILIVMILLFGGINLLMQSTEENTVQIDGSFYNVGEGELSLVLMTENGLDELSRFTRLKSLKIIPYKAAAASSLYSDEEGSETYNAAVKAKAEESFEDYTDIEDISFLTAVPQLTRLDISYCGTADISPLRELKGLRDLNMAYTNVTDISPLSEMDSITELVITGIPAEDITPLSDMEGLVHVKLTGSEEDETVKKLREKGVTVEVFAKEE